MPGVRTGDIGPKFGYHSKDNGWACFEHVRIPRENMLMGISHLDREGTFSIVGDPKVMYSTMMCIRFLLVKDSSWFMIATLMIALRYSACRRQFKTLKNSKDERKILDYQTHQHVLTPILA